MLLRALIVTCSLVLFFGSNARAATRTTAASGKWSDQTVWNGGVVPIAGDDVVIGQGTDIVLDLSTPILTSVKLDGTLHGGVDTLSVSSRFFGAGTFAADSGTVAFVTDNVAVLDAQSIPNYFNLWLGDRSHLSGTRRITRDLNIQHDLTADLRNVTGAKIEGTGSLTIGGSLIYVGDSTSWSGRIVMNDQNGVRLSRLRIAPPSGPAFLGPFLFPQITIDKPDSTYIVEFGFTDSSLFKNPALDSLIGDTLYIGTKSLLADTAIIVKSGTLDAGRGIFSCAGSAKSDVAGPFIQIASGARFRTGRVILPGKRAPFDSTIAPYIIADTHSTFEYYGNGLRGYVDVSYQTSTLVGGRYGNLWISNGTAAGFTFDTVHVAGTLLIEFGALVYPGLTNGPRSFQTIVIDGDVINENKGQSNSTGAGLDGDGMSSSNDTWIFRNPNDTSHWSGPSEISIVVIGPTTTLSVRFIDDTHCDSLYVVDSLDEELPPCGGHLIGRVFTRARRLDSLNHESNFGGLGLGIRAGSGPYPGLVGVMRTSGYLPPGSFNGNRDGHTIKRYFRITAQNGPQLQSDDTIEFAYHCLELNRAILESINFWRSSNAGVSWAISGISGIGSVANSFVLDTDAVGSSTLTNGYLWALSDQEVDEALSVGLESFTIEDRGGEVDLKWSTFAEVKSLGFEITRLTSTDTTTLSSWSTNPELRSTSKYGAKYRYADLSAPNGAITYRLSERNSDGAVLQLADRTITRVPGTQFSARLLNNPVLTGQSAKLLVKNSTGPVEVDVYDVTGRLFTYQKFDSAGNLSLHGNLPRGFFTIRVVSGLDHAIIKGVSLGQ